MTSNVDSLTVSEKVRANNSDVKFKAKLSSCGGLISSVWFITS